MEQLWYTWSSVGFGRATGLRVRAASSGLVDVVNSLDRFEPLGLHLSYDLPDEREADTLQPEDAATCLAFIKPGKDLREPQRILVNKRFSGFDFERRPHPFCHLLTDFPPTFTARDAITLWKSKPLWRYSAQGLDSDTRSLDALPGDLASRYRGPLTEADLQEVRQELPFVIQAFLRLLGTGQRLYIAAHPDAVARMIWGLTQVVPSGLLKELTFSTYEKEVTRSQALIVGTCWSSTAGRREPGLLQHLPASWELAINWYTGEISPHLKVASEPLEAEYAQFATAALLGNQHTSLLARVLERAERRQSATVKAFLAEYQSVVKRVITKQVVVTTLAHPQHASDDLSEPLFQDTLFDAVAEERRQEKKTMLAQLAELRKDADFPPGNSLANSLSEVAAKAAKEVVVALRKGNETRAWGTLEVLEQLDVLDPTAKSPPQEWPDVFAQLTTVFLKLTQQGKRPCSDELYRWLLQKWALLDPWLDAQLIGQWLNFGWEELENEGTARWPARWYPFYVHHLLQIDFPSQGAQQVGKHLRVFEIAFQALARDPQKWDALVQFIGSFALKGKSAEKTKLISAMLKAKRMDQSHLQQLFQKANLSADEVLTLLKQHSQSGAVDAFFDVLRINETWREREGRKVIQRLEKRLTTGQDQNLVSKGTHWARRLMSRGGKSSARVMAIVSQHLTQLATEALPGSVHQNQASLVSFLQDVLSRLAPASLNPQPWLWLMGQLAQEKKLRDQIRPWLLEAAAHIEYLDERLLQPWLEQANWSEFTGLFKPKALAAQKSPAAWYVAMLGALLKKQDTSLPASVLKLVQEQEGWFIEKLCLLFQQQSQQGVISFFGKLVKQGYSRKQQLLVPLLGMQGITLAQVEALWVAAALNSTEEYQVLELVLKQQAPDLVRLGYPGRPVTEALARYVPTMTLEPVDQKEALLAYLRGGATTPEGNILAQPLEQFTTRALQKAQGPVMQGEEQQIRGWMRLLAAAASIEREDIPWEQLLPNLPSSSKLRLLARLLGQKGLKRQRAAALWASAALKMAEKQQFRTQCVGPLVSSPQTSPGVKEFFQEEFGSPPLREEMSPAEVPQSPPDVSAQKVALPVRSAGAAPQPAPLGQQQTSEAEPTVVLSPDGQSVGLAGMPVAQQQVFAQPQHVERGTQSRGAQSARPAQMAQPSFAPEEVPFGQDFWYRQSISEFIHSPGTNLNRLVWVAQAFVQMPPGDKKERQRSQVLTALTTVLQTPEELEAYLPVLSPGLARDQIDGWYRLVDCVRKQAQDQDVDPKTLAKPLARKMTPYLQWLLAQQTEDKQNLLDMALANFIVETLALIDKAAASWPPEVYQQWQWYRQQRYSVTLRSGGSGGIRGFWERQLNPIGLVRELWKNPIGRWLLLVVVVLVVILLSVLYLVVVRHVDLLHLLHQLMNKLVTR